MRPCLLWESANAGLMGKYNASHSPLEMKRTGLARGPRRDGSVGRRDCFGRLGEADRCTRDIPEAPPIR